jgi:anti-repressor protein
MNELTVIGNSTKTMTSLEISELVEKRHDNVKRTIESLASGGVIEFPQSEEISTATKPVKVYLLDKRSSLIVVAQLSPEFTARVVDRWQELEVQAISQPFRLPSTFAEALRALADESEKTAALQKQIELDRPKTIFADAVTVSHTTILVGELAKLLKQNGFEIGQNRLFDRLRKDGWLIKRHGSDWNMPTQKGMELGLFEIKERTVNDANGAVRITKTVKVTGRGQVFFINMFVKERDGAVVPIQAEEREVVGTTADIAPIN